MREYRVLRRVPGPNREVYLAEKGDGASRGEYVLAVMGGITQDTRQRLEDDISRAQRLTHPAVMRVIEVFDHDDQQVAVTENVDGMSLHRLMKYLADNDEPLSDAAILYVGRAIVEALSEAHALRIEGRPRPVVHGQFGPHQVLLSWDGDVRLLGLGLSPVLRNVETPGWLIPFQAPERRKGSAPTPRSNVYTAASILWSLLTGRPVPNGEPFAPLRDLRPDLKGGVVQAIDNALSTTPLQRPSCKMLAMALSRHADDSDREELRWALEVCRVRCTVEEEFFPTASFPPSTSDKPPASNPPLSEDQVETEQYDPKDLLEKARLFGPLPWENGASKPGDAESADGDDLDVDVDEETSSQRSKRAKRSKRPRPPRSRRHLSGRKGGESPTSAEPSTKPAKERPRRSVSDDKLTLRAPPNRELKEGEVAPPPPKAMDQSGEYMSPQYRDPSAQGAGYNGSPSQPPSHYPPGHYPGSHHPGSHHPGSHHPASYYPPGVVPAGYYPGYGPQYAHGSHHPTSHHAPSSEHPPASGQAPGSQPYYVYPHPGVAPSYYPPGTVPPPPKGGRWWVGAVAVTAIVSFVLGIFIASGSVIEVKIAKRGENEAQAPTPPAPVSAAPASPTPAAAPAPSSVQAPVAPPAPSTEATTETPSEEVEPKTSDEPEGSDESEASDEPEATAPAPAEASDTIPPGKGLIKVSAPYDDAIVYVQGTQTGPLGEWFQVDCGVKYIRLGSRPLRVWYASGKAVDITCGGRTEVSFEKGPATPVRMQRRRKSRFLR